MLGQLELEALLDQRRSTADADERARRNEVEATVQDRLVALALVAVLVLLALLS